MSSVKWLFKVLWTTPAQNALMFRFSLNLLSIHVSFMLRHLFLLVYSDLNHLKQLFKVANNVNLKCPVCCVRGSLASLFSLAPPPLASSVVLKACSRFKSSQNTKPQLFYSYRPTWIQFLRITELHFFDSEVNWADRLSRENSLFSITNGQNGYWRWMSILNHLKHAQHVFSPLCRLKHSCLCTK